MAPSMETDTDHDEPTRVLFFHLVAYQSRAAPSSLSYSSRFFQS